uniref:Uncharacterized protein n=1 Tax=Panstrongylus lignarius TaxID=156445 RepID=A0A224Y5U5_9HEMI
MAVLTEVVVAVVVAVLTEVCLEVVELTTAAVVLVLTGFFGLSTSPGSFAGAAIAGVVVTGVGGAGMVVPCMDG